MMNIRSSKSVFDEYFFDLDENLIWLYLWVDVVVFIQLWVVAYDSFGFALVSSESLLYAVYVIIWASTCLSSLQQTI